MADPTVTTTAAPAPVAPVAATSTTPTPVAAPAAPGFIKREEAKAELEYTTLKQDFEAKVAAHPWPFIVGALVLGAVLALFGPGLVTHFL